MSQSEKVCENCGRENYTNFNVCYICSLDADRIRKPKSQNRSRIDELLVVRVKNEVDAKRKRIVAMGGTLQRCLICQNEIEIDPIICQSCLRAFHYEHLMAWLNEKEEVSCPACKVDYLLI